MDSTLLLRGKPISKDVACGCARESWTFKPVLGSQQGFWAGIAPDAEQLARTRVCVEEERTNGAVFRFRPQLGDDLIAAIRAMRWMEQAFARVDMVSYPAVQSCLMLGQPTTPDQIRQEAEQELGVGPSDRERVRIRMPDPMQLEQLLKSLLGRGIPFSTREIWRDVRMGELGLNRELEAILRYVAGEQEPTDWIRPSMDSDEVGAIQSRVRREGGGLGAVLMETFERHADMPTAIGRVSEDYAMRQNIIIGRMKDREGVSIGIHHIEEAGSESEVAITLERDGSYWQRLRRCDQPGWSPYHWLQAEDGWGKIEPKERYRQPEASRPYGATLMLRIGMVDAGDGSASGVLGVMGGARDAGLRGELEGVADTVQRILTDG